MLTVLVEYHGSSPKIPPTSGRIALESNGASSAPIILTGIQVAVHTTREERPAPQAIHFGSNVSGQPQGKPHDSELIAGIVNDHDMKGRAEI